MASKSSPTVPYCRFALPHTQSVAAPLAYALPSEMLVMSFVSAGTAERTATARVGCQTSPPSLRRILQGCVDQR